MHQLVKKCALLKQDRLIKPNFICQVQCPSNKLAGLLEGSLYHCWHGKRNAHQREPISQQRGKVSKNQFDSFSQYGTATWMKPQSMHSKRGFEL